MQSPVDLFLRKPPIFLKFFGHWQNLSTKIAFSMSDHGLTFSHDSSSAQPSSTLLVNPVSTNFPAMDLSNFVTCLGIFSRAILPLAILFSKASALRTSLRNSSCSCSLPANSPPLPSMDLRAPLAALLVELADIPNELPKPTFPKAPGVETGGAAAGSGATPRGSFLRILSPMANMASPMAFSLTALTRYALSSRVNLKARLSQ
mmetsp:Transcript_23845/g.44829  ORF Transcript_23845/g.44829 Transcript_23845/m.44829 type:complete len:204 (+) Transcript_23845:1202-1813(+)